MLVTLGGAGRTGGLPLVAASGPKRRALVRTLVAFCRAKALDGVDFNWEYPRDDADFASLASLLRAASAPFRDANLVATMAYHPLDGRSEAFLASANVARHVHLAHAMAYDRPDRDGRHASRARADATLAERDAPTRPRPSRASSRWACRFTRDTLERARRGRTPS